MTAPPLESLGRYKLKRVLGKGAMGVVYEGLDPRLNRTVAVKTILVGELDPATAQEYSMRFAREAQAVARLNHPNIVQVYDFGEEGEIAYIVMEYIRGKELKAAFDTGERFTLRESTRLMTELLDAIDFAHNEGVVHRDIKPANVMVDHEGHVKLADFGVARISDPDRQGATQVGTMVGTPAYMSPEQVQGLKIDRRTDIFSAGVVFYQFLTGQRPFQGGGAFSVAKRIVQDDPPAPSLIIDSISPEYDEIVSRALAKDPDKRFQSAGEFAEALQRAAEGLPAEAPVDDSTQMLSEGELPHADPALVHPSPAPFVPDAQGTEVELEFWRAIKDTDDPEELDLYIENFPQGVYVPLARRKLAELRGDKTSAADEAAEQARLAAEEEAKKQALLKARRETEERVRREAAEKARLEAEARAKREAEEKARREVEERARLEAEARAKREAEEKARREAEEKARLEAEARAKREAEEKARREAEEKARLEAEARAKREAEEAARRIAEERARLEALVRARREAIVRALRAAEAKAVRAHEVALKMEASHEARLAAEESVRSPTQAEAMREAERKALRAIEVAPKRRAREAALREAAANPPAQKE